MAKQDFLVSIDLNKNELLQAVIQNLATAPSSPVAGQIYYNTTDDKPYYYDDSSWVDFYGGIEKIIPGDGLVLDEGNPLGTEAEVTIHVQVDDSTIEINEDIIRIKDLGVVTSKIAANNVTLPKLAQIGSMKLLANVTGSAANVTEVSILTALTGSEDDTSLATSKAINDRIAAAITALGVLVGDHDASGSTFPTSGSGEGGDIQKGDYWYISVAGTMGDHTVNVGDVLYAKTDDPGSTSSNWFVVESNREQATETEKGVAEIATQAETDAGTDDLRYITPLKLITHLNNIVATKKKIFTLTGDDNTVSWNLTHSLNSREVTVEISQAASPYSKIMTEVKKTDLSNVQINFNVAPATGTNYKATVIG